MEWSEFGRILRAADIWLSEHIQLVPSFGLIVAWVSLAILAPKTLFWPPDSMALRKLCPPLYLFSLLSIILGAYPPFLFLQLEWEPYFSQWVSC
jgi:hypothetical protein